MNIGIALDGLLCDTDALRQEWLSRLGDEKFERDSAFWAALKPYEDVRESVALMVNCGYDIYVMAERPSAMFLTTRAWLRNNAGLNLNKDRLIVPAIKRYDCRLLGVGAFIDSDPAVVENLKIETVFPITPYLVDRSRGDSLLELVKEIQRSS